MADLCPECHQYLPEPENSEGLGLIESKRLKMSNETRKYILDTFDEKIIRTYAPHLLIDASHKDGAKVGELG